MGFCVFNLLEFLRKETKQFDALSSFIFDIYIHFSFIHLFFFLLSLFFWEAFLGILTVFSLTFLYLPSLVFILYNFSFNYDHWLMILLIIYVKINFVFNYNKPAYWHFFLSDIDDGTALEANFIISERTYLSFRFKGNCFPPNVAE